MKKSIKIFPFLILSLLSLSSCIYFGPKENSNLPPPTPQYKPILLDRNTFENSVTAIATQNISKSGKIYIKDNLMFVNDVNKGFHVYNYTNPQTPVKIGFIKIVGATDIAVRDNMIYINQAVDLVTLSYNSTTNAIQVLYRNRNVFPQKLSPVGDIAYQANNDKIVIDWIQQ